MFKKIKDNWKDIESFLWGLIALIYLSLIIGFLIYGLIFGE